MFSVRLDASQLHRTNYLLGTQPYCLLLWEWHQDLSFAYRYQTFSLEQILPFGKLQIFLCDYLSSSNLKHDSYNGKLTVPGVCRDTVFTAADLLDEGEIGRGAFGFVNRMIHTPTGVVMAVKVSCSKLILYWPVSILCQRIRSTLNESEQTKTLKDLDVVVNSTNCAHIVRFYGALFQEGDCWICMEMMATSLDKFYKFVYHNLRTRIPETVLGKIATAVSK